MAQLVRLIGSSIQELEMFTEVADEDRKLKLVAVQSKARKEWLLVELACAMYGFTIVAM